MCFHKTWPFLNIFFSFCETITSNLNHSILQMSKSSGVYFDLSGLCENLKDERGSRDGGDDAKDEKSNIALDCAFPPTSAILKL